MQVGFIQNAMYFVGMVLFTWLGFRMANNIYNNADANMLSKVFTSVFCIFVAAFMFGVNQIGGSIEEASLTAVLEFGLDENYVMINIKYMVKNYHLAYIRYYIHLYWKRNFKKF